MVPDDFRADVGHPLEPTFDGFVFPRIENEEPPLLQSAFPIAPSGRLHDGIDSGKRPIYNGEIEVHPCLDELRRDDPAGPALFQGCANFGNRRAAVLCTHVGAEVPAVTGRLDKVEESGRVPPRVDDAENLFVFHEEGREIRIGKQIDEFRLNTLQRLVQFGRSLDESYRLGRSSDQAWSFK